MSGPPERTHRDPCPGGCNAQAKPKHKMRIPGEALAKRIEEQDRKHDWGKNEAGGAKLARGYDKQQRGRDCETPGETAGKQAGG